MAETKTKGPLSYLSGSLTSGLFCAFSVWITLKLITYYSLHPPHYSQQFAQSIATALKTLIIGSGCVAVFSFGLIAAGLLMLFFQALFQNETKPAA
jgi:hypothetical protein|tara:strand:+ start:629 stop:916 length:288 start_codon:yes stop_codon:yes gene_type:complete